MLTSSVVQSETPAAVPVLDLDEGLTALVRRARDVTGADVAYLALRDEQTGEFAHRSSVGTRTGEFTSVRVGALRGLAALAAESGGAVVSNDFFNDPRGNHDIDGYLRAEGLRSVICAPIELEGQLIGLLFAADHRTVAFGRADAEILAALAHNAAVAIVNARLYEAERRTSAELRAMHATVLAQHERLQRWISDHDRLTHMALGGHPLDRIARTLANLVDNPLVVLDRFFRPLASATPGREDLHDSGLPVQALSEDAVRQAMLARLQEYRTTALPAGAVPTVDIPSVVSPIVSGRDLLGFIWLLELNSALDEQDVVALERTATILAVALMREKITAEVETRLRGDLLNELIAGTSGNDAALLVRATHLGYDLSGPFRVLVVDLDDFAGYVADRQLSESAIIDLKELLLASTARSLSGTGAHPLLAARNDSVTILLPDSAADVARAATLQSDVLRALNGPVVSVGVGSSAADLRAIPRSYAHALRALKVGRWSGQEGVVACFDDLGIDSLLVDVASHAEVDSLLGRTVQPLLAYDSRHGADLVRTLEQYLRRNCSMELAAADLFVHPHTLRYRLKRIGEITGLDMSDSEVRLQLQLAIRVLRLRGPVIGDISTPETTHDGESWLRDP